MANNSSIFNSKKLPIAFLLALSGIIIFESLNLVFDKYLNGPPYDGLFIYTKNEISQNPKNRFDYIVLGDCRAQTGIMPTYIDTITGLSGFNLATTAVQTVFASYCFLKRYLESCAKKPKFLILTFLRESCYCTKKEAEAHLNIFYDFKDKNESLLVDEFGLKEAYVYFIPSLKHQYLFNDGFKSFSNLWSTLTNLNGVDPFVKGIWAARGYEEPIKREFTYGLKIPEIEKFEVSDFFDKYLRAILDLADSNDIKVIYAVPTDYGDYYEAEKAAGSVDAYINYLEHLRMQKHNLIVFFPQDDFKSRYLYESASHLNYYGGLRLSEDLAYKMIELEGIKK